VSSPLISSVCWGEETTGHRLKEGNRKGVGWRFISSRGGDYRVLSRVAVEVGSQCGSCCFGVTVLRKGMKLVSGLARAVWAEKAEITPNGTGPAPGW
jgi:hypothetical protein